jgi:PTS system mannose-specific IID component
MQTLGFAYALEPALKRIYDDDEDRKAAVERHLEFFNTNPLLASAIVGCVVRLEEERGAEVDEAVRGIKTALMGPYGAMGDSLYWGALKPLFVLIALHAAYRGALWAPWVLVVLFAAANVGGRLYGFLRGYREGLGVVEAIARLNLVIWSRRIKAVCALLLGTLLALAAGPTLLPAWGVPTLVWGGGALFFVIAAAWIIGKGVRPAWLAYTAALVAYGVVAWT